MTRRAARTAAPHRKGQASRPGQPIATGSDRPLWQRSWPAAAILAAALSAYGNALNNPFVFDDGSTIAGNPTIRDLWGSLAGGPVQLATAGRPLVNFTFAIDHAVGGLEPFQYHATNLIILVMCGWLLYGVVRRILTLPRLADLGVDHATGLAACIALLWTVHPLNSEVINYVTQRTESLMALAYLAAVYAGIRGMTSQQPLRWYGLSVFSCAAGMACKESMITAPVAILLIDAALITGSLSGAIRRRSIYYAALFATWMILALLIIEGPRFRSAGFSSGVDPWTYLLNQAPMLLRYLRVAVLPVGLVLDYGLPRGLSLSDVLVPGVVITALLVLTAASWRLPPRAALAATLFFVLLAPTSSVVPIATEVGAERRMFLPLAVLVTLTVLAAWQLGIRRVSRTASASIVLVIAVVLLGLTVRRNAEYHDAIRIWETVVQRWPQGRAHYNLGIALKAAGRRPEALEEYRRALADAPQAHYALAFELQSDGRYGEAVDEYRTFIRLVPMDAEVPRTYHQIGRALMALGRLDEAASAFREALARLPGHADSLAGLADTLLAQNKLDEAVTAYRNFLARNPDRPDASMNLGLALVKLNRDAEARDVFARVVQLQPDNVAAHVNLAYALANTGRYGDSVREFRRAAELEPDPTARAEIQAAIGELLGNH